MIKTDKSTGDMDVMDIKVKGTVILLSERTLKGKGTIIPGTSL